MPSRYRRVIVKLSGEALGGPDGAGLASGDDRARCRRSGRRQNARHLTRRRGRRRQSHARRTAERRFARETGDAMGMLATVINALALEAAIKRAGADGAHAVGARHAASVRELFAPARARSSWPTATSLCSPAAPAIRISPPTRPLCCAPPKWAAMPCSRRPMSTASTAPTPRKTPRRRALTPHASGRDRPKSQGYGCHGLCACPRKPYAYHRVLDSNAGAVEAVLRGKGHATTVGD